MRTSNPVELSNILANTSDGNQVKIRILPAVEIYKPKVGTMNAETIVFGGRVHQDFCWILWNLCRLKNAIHQDAGGLTFLG